MICKSSTCKIIFRPIKDMDLIRRLAGKTDDTGIQLLKQLKWDIRNSNLNTATINGRPLTEEDVRILKTPFTLKSNDLILFLPLTKYATPIYVDYPTGSQVSPFQILAAIKTFYNEPYTQGDINSIRSEGIRTQQPSLNVLASQYEARGNVLRKEGMADRVLFTGITDFGDGNLHPVIETLPIAETVAGTAVPTVAAATMAVVATKAGTVIEEPLTLEEVSTFVRPYKDDALYLGAQVRDSIATSDNPRIRDLIDVFEPDQQYYGIEIRTGLQLGYIPSREVATTVNYTHPGAAWTHYAIFGPARTLRVGTNQVLKEHPPNPYMTNIRFLRDGEIALVSHSNTAG